MTLRRVALTAVLAAVATGVTAVPAAAAPPPDATANQFYYTVAASYQGTPENLWEVAGRFLGDAGRAGEILDLNSGRVQSDGGRVSDASRLRAGWNLVLPWDAVGADLHYGSLPATTDRSSACTWDADVPAATAWGQTLLTPNRAWSEADGSGVKVAVIGSGVDGYAPELAGRVSVGADIVAGTGRADTDCRGAGTALAGIVAGDDGGGGKRFGVAPRARIVPIKAGGPTVPSRIAATAIDVATAAGVQVILVGVGVDASDPAVRAAVGDAIARDVVVVLPATAAADPADGLLRVGAVADDRQPVTDYPGGSVDLLAPGVDVASIGQPGSGDEYAAAFVAGVVALVRSAHPKLHAADVTRQVRDTAAEGLVKPVAAVTTPLPGGVGVNAAAETPTSGLGTLSRVLLWVGAGLAALVLLGFLLQRPARKLAEAVARRRARRQALAAQARMANDNDDPFWEPPASGDGQAAHDEVAGLSGPGR
jgi:hypothetical protein